MMEKVVGNNPMLLVKAARRGIEFWKVGVAALEVAGQHLLEKVQQPRDGKRLMLRVIPPCHASIFIGPGHGMSAAMV